MSSNIYECMDDERGGLENRADSESVESNVMTQERTHTQRPPPAVKRNLFKTTTLILALLCLLLLVRTVLYKFYIMSVLEDEQPNIKNEKLMTNLTNLTTNFCQIGEENQTQGSIIEWKRFRCSCYYISTEMKTWTDSREDCQKRGAHLVIINNIEEEEYVSKINEHGDSWIGLESVKTSDWGRTWSWTWLDRSTPKYVGWKVGVKANPEDGSKAYVDQQGRWSHTNTYNQTKHWICEREIY
ncbi:CD209 antigen-like protein E isoform X2 [Mugil cephalus]|uniref:CD209 antigen-like protein E isoform X2 n=1 Tax=Mugil cephalus TaxID=48193 RepID=UPI001FB5C6B3|nr:CD209 antigen-like protein E isoform X2 [Mugil cephalus]